MNGEESEWSLMMWQHHNEGILTWNLVTTENKHNKPGLSRLTLRAPGWPQLQADNY